ncbi:MAG: hypothetical protein CSA22_10550 [Deltaproteobacteria bacterium]|nr:MAG: hypothetical protein CSA22_10550 [Deltaproteobacteria bacterium]
MTALPSEQCVIPVFTNCPAAASRTPVPMPTMKTTATINGNPFDFIDSLLNLKGYLYLYFRKIE